MPTCRRRVMRLVAASTRISCPSVTSIHTFPPATAIVIGLSLPVSYRIVASTLSVAGEIRVIPTFPAAQIAPCPTATVDTSDWA